MRTQRIRAGLFLPALLLVAAIAGCASAGVRASHGLDQTRTVASSGNSTPRVATPQSNSVSVVVSAKEQGTIADHTARLAIQVTLTNNAAKPIEIIYPCGSDPIQFALRDSATSAFISGSDTYSCPLKPSSLYPPAIAVGAIRTYLLADDLSQVTLAPGEYVLSVTVSWQDAQGATSPPGANPTVYGTATQQVTVTLQ